MDLLNQTTRGKKKKEQQMYYINLLKPWKTRENCCIMPYLEEPELGPQVNDSLKENSVPFGEILNQKEKELPAHPVKMFMIHHHINMKPGKVIRERL